MKFGLVWAAGSTYIQEALQHSGHTETSSRVRVHMCRTPQLRLSMTSSSIWAAGLRSQSAHHTKTRSRSTFINPGLGAVMILRGTGSQESPAPTGMMWCSPSCRTLFSFQSTLCSGLDSPSPGGSSLDEQGIHIQQLTSQLDAHWAGGGITKTKLFPEYI